MKITQIDLKAFGHFTGRHLRLAGDADFHIICGPNEAGKTTLWRAINGALFGIAERTQDSFLHDMKKLRIGLTLQSSAGEQLALMRRKGRGNTLLAYDPTSGEELTELIPEERLAAWLGGLSRPLFLKMFSLDHATLVSGGEALAQGQGDAGESLFEAGAGLTSVRALRARLESEHEALFKPRASTAAINKALSAMDDARREVREASIRPAAWTAAHAAMEAASDAYEAAKATQTQLQREMRRLERLQAILPEVATLRFKQTQLDALSSVPLLPAEATGERIAAMARHDNANETVRVVSSRIDTRLRELASLDVSEAILGEAEAIEAIHHATAAYREALVELATGGVAIQGAQTALAAAARQIASDATPQEILPWMPDATRVARIRALVTRGAPIQASYEESVKALTDKQREVTRLETDLQQLGDERDATRLVAYLDAISIHGDPESQARQRRHEADQAAAAVDAEALDLMMPSADAMAAVTVPLDTVVQDYKSQTEALIEEARANKQSIKKIEDDLATLRGDMAGLTISGEVPTREAVIAERTHRDALWTLIRRRYLPVAGEVPPTEAPSAADYEQAVAGADALADGLFNDAERATTYAGYRVRESQMQASLTLHQDRAADNLAGQNRLQQQWADLLARHGLPSMAIGEAAAWLMKREALLQKRAGALAKRGEAQAMQTLAHEIRQRIGELLQTLQADPPADGESLSELLTRARLLTQRVAEQNSQRTLKQTDLVTARHAVTSAEQAVAASRAKLDDWQRQWSDAMHSIRLASNASPEEATARIDQFAALQAAHNTLDVAMALQQTAQIKIDDYQQRLADTWQRVRGTVMPQDVSGNELRAAALYRELSEVRDRAQQRNTLQQQIDDDRQTLADASVAVTTSQATIDALLRQANCRTLDELARIEEQSSHRAALATDVYGIEIRLVQSSGLSLPEVLAQAGEQDPDAVAEALANNEQSLNDNASLLQTCHEQYLSARRELEAMDGSATAADARQTLAQHTARIAELSADYAASKIASAILAQVIEAYQKRNQGPLIETASARYAAITSGRFAGVVIDYDEDRQVLKAVRADGTRLAMDELSTGRRDQLFLALRLAAIEGHIARGEPLPIIIDDILIQFDDEAAAATFKVLADLSRRTQVIYLTHHGHLGEGAAGAGGREAFSSHSLAS